MAEKNWFDLNAPKKDEKNWFDLNAPIASELQETKDNQAKNYPTAVEATAKFASLPEAEKQFYPGSTKAKPGGVAPEPAYGIAAADKAAANLVYEGSKRLGEAAQGLSTLPGRLAYDPAGTVVGAVENVAGSVPRALGDIYQVLRQGVSTTPEATQQRAEGTSQFISEIPNIMTLKAAVSPVAAKAATLVPSSEGVLNMAEHLPVVGTSLKYVRSGTKIFREYMDDLAAKTKSGDVSNPVATKSPKVEDLGEASLKETVEQETPKSSTYVPGLTPQQSIRMNQLIEKGKFPPDLVEKLRSGKLTGEDVTKPFVPYVGRMTAAQMNYLGEAIKIIQKARSEEPLPTVKLPKNKTEFEPGLY